MSRQFGRVCQVIIGSGGRGLLVSELRVKFEVTKNLAAAPNTAVIRIYNLNQQHEQQIKTEFDEVLMNAGYKDSAKQIFRGNIQRVYRYPEGPDYVTEIEAGDGDRDYHNATVNVTLAAGTDVKHMLGAVADSFRDVVLGFVEGAKGKPRVRGRTIIGDTREVLHHIAAESNASWSIQDGRLTIVETNKMLPNQAIEVNANTGMIEAPEVTDKGISVRTLLNPAVLIHSAIHLNNNEIKHKVRHQKTSNTKIKVKPETGPMRLDPDGIYRVVRLIHRGDTRGKDWHTDMECLS